MILPAALFDNLNCNGDPLVQSKQNQQQNSQDYTKNNGCKMGKQRRLRINHTPHNTKNMLCVN